MPQSNKKKIDRDQGQRSSKNPAIKKIQKSGRTTYLIISLVLVVIFIIVGFGYYQQYIVPFQRTVITFDDTVIKMRYFLERAKTSGSSGMSTLQNLTNELCIKEGAARFGITVTPEDVDYELHIQATGSDNVTISDAEFKEWYRQLLNERKISSYRYREIVTAILLETRLREHISSDISSVLEHAHVYVIYTTTYEEAAEVKERIDAGESFTKVAREISLEMIGEESDGEYGWIPKGATVFNQDPFFWEAGSASQVLAYLDESSSSSSTTSNISFYYLLYTSEVEDREVQANFLAEVQNTAFQEWLTDEMKLHSIHYVYNSEIDKWVSWQLTKSNTTSS